MKVLQVEFLSEQVTFNQSRITRDMVLHMVAITTIYLLNSILTPTPTGITG